MTASTCGSRLVIAVLTIAVLAGAGIGEAQEARSVTIGVLGGMSREWRKSSLEALRTGLRELGWEEGKNLAVEERFADGELSRVPALAEELVRRNVDLIIAASSSSTRAAMTATKTKPIPIVMVDVGDPLASKFVTNLARPGGSVTGFTNLALGLTEKRLAILKEMLPGATRVALLAHTDSPIRAPQWRDAAEVAPRLGLTLHRMDIRNRGDLPRAFQAAANARADAVMALADALNTVLTREILELGAKHRLPVMVEDRERVEAGGLLSYAAEPRETYRRAASYVDRILRGTKPGDLPVEQPTTFELLINLRTAKSLGLAIPPTVLLRADAVIE